jgi:hypothetical protein
MLVPTRIKKCGGERQHQNGKQQRGEVEETFEDPLVMMKVERSKPKYILAVRGVQCGIVFNVALATNAVSDKRTVAGWLLAPHAVLTTSVTRFFLSFCTQRLVLPHEI